MDEPSETTADRNLFVWLLLLALTPVLAAAWGTYGVPSGRAYAQAPKKGLVLHRYRIQRGEVPAQPTIPIYFPFSTQGEQPVRITGLKPSCGCLQPRLLDDREREIQGTLMGPNASGSIYVGVSTANESPGPHKYSVEVTYDDGTIRIETVNFELIIPEQKVLLDPPQLLFYQLSGTPDSREIHVTDARGKKLQVLGARLSRPIAGVTLEIEPREITTTGHWQTPIRVSVPAEMPAERQSAYIILETDDPEFSKLVVPLMVHGRTPPIQQSPVQQPAVQPAALSVPAVPDLPSPR